VCVSVGLVASPVRVRMEGGDLQVTVSADLDLTLQGPVEAIGEFTMDAEWLRRRSS
jgi:diaminopimelate epimerase